MLKLVVRRLLSAIAVLFVVSLITFVVLLCIPGDPAQLILGVEATPEKVEALRASMGLDRPWYVQYMHWIQGVLTGNWGTSYLYGENVWTLICQRLPVTFSVALLSMAAALVVSAILGILAALKKGSPMDLLSRTVMQIGGAVPSFWLAMLFMLLFSSYLGWFPVTGYTAPGENFGAFLKCIALPSLVLAIGELGILIRIVRSSMLTALQQDFMMSANVKGLPPARAIVHYALRSAIIAPITISGMQLAKLLGGTVIVETIFALPGIGRLMLTAVEQRDIILCRESCSLLPPWWFWYRWSRIWRLWPPTPLSVPERRPYRDEEKTERIFLGRCYHGGQHRSYMYHFVFLDACRSRKDGYTEPVCAAQCGTPFRDRPIWARCPEPNHGGVSLGSAGRRVLGHRGRAGGQHYWRIGGHAQRRGARSYYAVY